jgi:tetratricopeptide (TPR) repeat protein
MTSGQTDTDTKSELRSVEELKAKLKLRPDDVDLKEELASALTYRYIYGEGEQAAGNEADIKCVREILEELPEDKALFPRAYLAYRDGKKKEFTEKLVRFAQYEEGVRPFDSGELLGYFIAPFDSSPELWLRLADALDQVHAESASVLTLRGLVKLDDDDNLGAIYDFVCALEKDKDYWLAAWQCALVHSQENNWHAARNYYYRALRSQVAQEIPEIHFSLAWCLGRLKDYPGEEEYYRSCLEIDSDYPYARNNLGWSLHKQGKFDEALEVFEEAIIGGNDGKYPLRNKARTLKRLGRFQEAVEILEQDIYRGKLTKFAREEIAILEVLIKHGEALSTQEIKDFGELEEDGAVVEGVPEEFSEELSRRGPVESKQRIRSRSISTRFPREQWLESMIEEMIQKGLPVLGRKLRIYDHPGEGYGRQFAIPGVGLIDLLVEEIETSDLIVIELKRDRSDDKVIGQASTYMT